MTDFARCPAYGTPCEYVARVETLTAENERLQREVKKQRSLRDQYRAAWEAEKARAAMVDTQ